MEDALLFLTVAAKDHRHQPLAAAAAAAAALDASSEWLSIRDYGITKLEKIARDAPSVFGWFGGGLWPFVLEQQDDPIKLKRLVTATQTILDIEALCIAVDVLADAPPPIVVSETDLERRLAVEIVDDIVKNDVCFKKFDAVVSIKLDHLKRRAAEHIKRREDEQHQRRQKGIPTIVDDDEAIEKPPAVVPLDKEDKEDPSVPDGGVGGAGAAGDSTCILS